MSEEELKAALTAGKSLEVIARERKMHASTVAYWARKYGLRSAGSERFAARGEPDRAQLEALAAQGATLAEMANALDRSIGTVRHWLRRWEIVRTKRAGRAPVDREDAEPVVEMICAHHGRTRFRLEGRGYYRCMQCRQQRVSEWRRRVKRRLVEEGGGMCRLCGYRRCVAALQFHHIDRTEKAFELSRQGVTRSLAEARHEASKCVLLCANCHAEVESGVTPCADSIQPVGTPRGGFEPPRLH